MKFQIEAGVKYYDCDPSGVMHNVKYFYLLEEARNELGRNAGCSYLELEKKAFCFH